MAAEELELTYRAMACAVRPHHNAWDQRVRNVGAPARTTYADLYNAADLRGATSIDNLQNTRETERNKFAQVWNSPATTATVQAFSSMVRIVTGKDLLIKASTITWRVFIKPENNYPSYLSGRVRLIPISPWEGPEPQEGEPLGSLPGLTESSVS